MSAILDFLSNLPRELYVFIISMLPIVELRAAIPIGAGLDIPFYLNYVLAIVGNLIPVPFILYFITKFMDFLSRFKIFRPMINWIRRKADKHSSKVIKDDAPKKETQDEISSAEISEKACSAEDPKESRTLEGSEKSCSAESSEGACSLESIEDTATKEAAPDGRGQHPEKSTSAAPRKMTRAIFIALMLFVAIPIPGTGAWTGSLVAALFDLPKKRSLLAIFVGVLLSGVIMTLASYGFVGFLGIFA